VTPLNTTRTLVTRPQDYTKPVRLRLEMLATSSPSYIRALRGKALITREIDRALDGVDALVLPALAIPAPPLGATTMPVKGGTDSAHVDAALLAAVQFVGTSRHLDSVRPLARRLADRPAARWAGRARARAGSSQQAAIGSTA
jgi:hypothetical protein